MTPLEGMLIRIALACLFSALAGCASTTVRNASGQTILHTQADAQDLEFHQGDTSLHVVRLDHSTPTRAGGSVIGTTGTAVAGAAAAVLTRGLK